MLGPTDDIIDMNNDRSADPAGAPSMATCIVPVRDGPRRTLTVTVTSPSGSATSDSRIVWSSNAL